VKKISLGGNNKRIYVAAIMIVALLVNAYRFWGEWNDFYSVIVVQLLFGQGFFSYISGKEINVAPGGGVKAGAHPLLRALIGWSAFLAYILMFFFSGY